MNHQVVAIVPADDLDVSEAFYARLGFERIEDYGDYRILADGRGWHLHLTQAGDWRGHADHNPFGLYLYVEDVDAVAERVRDEILEEDAPHVKPWGCYEFSLSDPTGVLVRVGRVV